MTVRNELLKNIRQVEPYVPGEQPQHRVIKLNTNENPYPPSPRVAEALGNLDADILRLSSLHIAADCIKLRFRTVEGNVIVKIQLLRQIVIAKLHLRNVSGSDQITHARTQNWNHG